MACLAEFCTFHYAHLMMRYLIRSLGLLRLSSAYVSFPADSTQDTEFWEHTGIGLESKTPGCEKRFAHCFLTHKDLKAKLDCIERLRSDCVSKIEEEEREDQCTGSEAVFLYRARDKKNLEVSANGKDVCYVYSMGEFPHDFGEDTKMFLHSTAAEQDDWQFRQFIYPQDYIYRAEITDEPKCQAEDKRIDVKSFAFWTKRTLALRTTMMKSAQMEKYLTIHVTKTGALEKNGTEELNTDGLLHICGKVVDFKPRARSNKWPITGAIVGGLGAATAIIGGSVWKWKQRSSTEELEAYFEQQSDDRYRLGTTDRESRNEFV